MDLAELINGLDLRHVAGPDPSGVRVTDLTEDSRTVVPGSLFVARAGGAVDGKKFAAAAIEAGAAAILCDDPAWRPGVESAGDADAEPPITVLSSSDVLGTTARMAERFYGDPTAQLVVIGVTGTNGKTTVAHLVHQLLNRARIRCGLIGTIETDDGRERAPTGMTTPPAIELSRSMATMLEHGCRACVMEVSSHALDQRRADGLGFDVGVFTNLTGDHYDYHGSPEAYAAAKARLFEMLPRTGAAVMNGDDAAHERMLEDCPARAVRCYAAGEDDAGSLGGARKCLVERIAFGGPSQRLRLKGPWGAIETTVALIGDHNAMNVLQAAAAAHEAVVALGLEEAAASSSLAIALPELAPPPGRLERMIAGPSSPHEAPVVLVDYAHTDDGLRHALMAARACTPPGGRLHVVFGCGGDRDATKRPRMGAVATELADRVVITSDNPRSEKPSVIVDGILAGIGAEQRAKTEVHVQREQAIRVAIGAAEAGDVVLVAGKGHETEQILAGPDGKDLAVPFDEREHARAALAAWFENKSEAEA